MMPILIKKWHRLRSHIQRQWQQGSKREQVLVMMLGWVCCSAILYYLAHSLYMTVLDLRQETAMNVQTIHDVQPLYTQWQQLHKAQTATPRISPSSLLSHIDQSLNQSNLTRFNPQLQQIERNKVRVSFDSANFDDVIAWLSSLWQQFNIKVDELSVSAKESPGLIEANVVLSL